MSAFIVRPQVAQTGLALLQSAVFSGEVYQQLSLLYCISKQFVYSSTQSSRVREIIFSENRHFNMFFSFRHPVEKKEERYWLDTCLFSSK